MRKKQQNKKITENSEEGVGNEGLSLKNPKEKSNTIYTIPENQISDLSKAYNENFESYFYFLSDDTIFQSILLSNIWKERVEKVFEKSEYDIKEMDKISSAIREKNIIVKTIEEFFYIIYLDPKQNFDSKAYAKIHDLYSMYSTFRPKEFNNILSSYNDKGENEYLSYIGSYKIQNIIKEFLLDLYWNKIVGNSKNNDDEQITINAVKRTIKNIAELLYEEIGRNIQKVFSIYFLKVYQNFSNEQKELFKNTYIIESQNCFILDDQYVDVYDLHDYDKLYESNAKRFNLPDNVIELLDLYCNFLDIYKDNLHMIDNLILFKKSKYVHILMKTFITMEMNTFTIFGTNPMIIDSSSDKIYLSTKYILMNICETIVRFSKTPITNYNAYFIPSKNISKVKAIFQICFDNSNNKLYGIIREKTFGDLEVVLPFFNNINYNNLSSTSFVKNLNSILKHGNPNQENDLKRIMLTQHTMNEKLIFNICDDNSALLHTKFTQEYGYPNDDYLHLKDIDSEEKYEKYILNKIEFYTKLDKYNFYSNNKDAYRHSLNVSNNERIYDIDNDLLYTSIFNTYFRYNLIDIDSLGAIPLNDFVLDKSALQLNSIGVNSMFITQTRSESSVNNDKYINYDSVKDLKTLMSKSVIKCTKRVNDILVKFLNTYNDYIQVENQFLEKELLKAISNLVAYIFYDRYSDNKTYIKTNKIIDSDVIESINEKNKFEIDNIYKDYFMNETNTFYKNSIEANSNYKRLGVSNILPNIQTHKVMELPFFDLKEDRYLFLELTLTNMKVEKASKIPYENPNEYSKTYYIRVSIPNDPTRLIGIFVTDNNEFSKNYKFDLSLCNKSFIDPLNEEDISEEMKLQRNYKLAGLPTRTDDELQKEFYIAGILSNSITQDQIFASSIRSKVKNNFYEYKNSDYSLFFEELEECMQNLFDKIYINYKYNSMSLNK